MKKACDGEFPDAFARYGEFLSFGLYGLKRNPNLALEYYIKGVQFNDPRSMYRLGMDIIERGTGTKDDVGLAVHYITTASQMGKRLSAFPALTFPRRFECKNSVC